MPVRRKRLLIQGATGSIGRSTLSVVREQREHFEVVGLAAGTDLDSLLKIADEFGASSVALSDAGQTAELRQAAIARDFWQFFSGTDAVGRQATECDFDLLVNALSGSTGYEPTAAALRRGIPVALANKETLVAAGPIMKRLAREHQAQILPIDSEHSALFQCLIGEDPAAVRRIYLTTSGGPFWGRRSEDLKSVTVAEALAHPTWKMGRKVTVDSATLFNKGLEVIEVERLFGVPSERIEVIAHRQSYVHSMVEFVDGSIKAQLSMPDMRLPILYALSFPDRLQSSLVTTDFASTRTWTFEPVAREDFPCLDLAFRALRKGGTAPAALSAADEVAVDAFLAGKIAFTDIAEVLDRTLSDWPDENLTDLEDVRDADRRARTRASEHVQSLTLPGGGESCY